MENGNLTYLNFKQNNETRKVCFMSSMKNQKHYFYSTTTIKHILKTSKEGLFTLFKLPAV